LGINNKGTLILSMHVVRTFLIIYYSIFVPENIELTLALIGIISVIYIVFDMRDIIFEIFNTISLMAVIYFINSLNTYMIEVEATTSIQIIRIALILFTLMYVIYYFRNWQHF